MRSSILPLALFASLALSKPVHRRGYVTVEDIVTVYTTVTEGSAPTRAGNHQWYTHTHTYTPATTSIAATSSSAVEVPTSTSVDVTTSSSTSTESPTTSSTTTEAAVPTTSSTSTVAESTTSEQASSTSSTTSAAAATSSSASTYEGIVLEQHNLHRANHSASDLVWNSTLADIALSIAQTCVYEHNTTAGGGGYGQNIGAGSAPADVGAMITDDMYNGEIGYYPLPYGENDPDMSDFENWGHFSQIVWKETTSIGCATYQCSTLENVSSDVEPYFTVCNYGPPGNYAGEYSNVGTPLGDATVTVAS